MDAGGGRRRFTTGAARAAALVPAALLLAAGCGSRLRAPLDAIDRGPTRTVYVVSLGWHAGLVLRRQDVPAGAWPEPGDFPDADYLEVGWGDRRFYQAREPTSGLALRAAFRPGDSVLHLVGLDGPVERHYPAADLVGIRLPAAGFARLVEFLERAHARDAGGRPVPLGPGLYGRSRFYLARDRYSLLATCNVWTARALRAAGCRTVPGLTLTASSVLEQARTTCPRSGPPEG